MPELVDVIEHIRNAKITMTINPNDIWTTYDANCKPITDQDWHEVKFLNDTGNELNPEIANVPNNHGGVYIFVAKSDIIKDTHVYLLYIGRVQKTDDQNLRKRFREYYYEKMRPRIILMREAWGKNLYIRYFPLDDNDVICTLEEELIRVILPPCNSKYPGIYNQAMQAAFM